MSAKEYRSDDVSVTFDPERCIHAEECVNGLPEVFDTEKRPWVQPQNAPASSVSRTVARCPTGALRFTLPDGPEEKAPEENRIILDEDGPLFVRGDVEITHTNGEKSRETRVALCRCGASKNKPLCDNSHIEAEFHHDGSLGEDRLKDGEETKSKLGISTAENGPLLVSGEVEVFDSRGEASYSGSKATLCRCGRSENKPFCDGSHKRSGWRED